MGKETRNKEKKVREYRGGYVTIKNEEMEGEGIEVNKRRKRENKDKDRENHEEGNERIRREKRMIKMKSIDMDNERKEK